VKNSFTVKTAFLAAAALALSIAPPCLTAQTAASPKQRIEQEFRQLETNLTRYVHSTVLNAPNLDSMNRALDGFMRENAGVKRILRTNAGGFTVNDVSSGQPHSAPSRNVSSQRWLQTLTQSKSPYYSSSVDSAGALTLFYAWPIMSGPDKSHFSGAFAARIDFTTVVALIENIAPFQLALGGRAFLQHEWDGVDYNEEPLGVRGAQDITIRTVKPLATRQTPRNSPSPSVPVVVVSEAGAVTLSAEDPALTPAAEAQSGGAAGKNTDVLLKSSVQLIMALIVMVVAVMLVIVIFRVRRHSSRAEGRFFMEEETYFVDKKQRAGL